jgi:hypothetical protein
MAGQAPYTIRYDVNGEFAILGRMPAIHLRRQIEVSSMELPALNESVSETDDVIDDERDTDETE